MNGPVLILGAGRSGLAAARLLHARGVGGWVACESTPAPSVTASFAQLGFACQAGLPRAAPFQSVLSPGFAIDHPWLTALRARQVDLLPEFELGARSLRGPVLAITGSLGKTTMATLAAKLLEDAGKRATLSGNIGVPVCEVAVAQPEADLHVIELSSFQLEASVAFRPSIGICLNLAPNHLDRHRTLEAYAAAKARMFRFQQPDDLAVWPEPFQPQPVTAARRAVTGPRGWHWRPGGLWQGDAFRLDLRGTLFDGPALGQNLSLLWAGLEPIGLDPATALRTLRGFQALAHRMQRLDIPGAGAVVDDSKSTCLAATRAALESLSGPVHLIAGGLGKGESLDALTDLLASRPVSLYLIGRSAPEMRAAWESSAVFCRECGDLATAVRTAWTRRNSRETLLLSPGCASFDQFAGFTERGIHFQREVQACANQHPLCPLESQETT